MAENTGAKRHNPPPVEHQFKPGNSGRPKGARNKLGEAFIEALHDSFKTRGIEAIEKVIDEKPEQYLKVIASLMPKDVNLNINDDTGEMSDDELAERIQRLTAAVAPFLDRRAGNDTEASGETQTPRVH